MNLGRPGQKPAVDAPFKHVIAEYVHRARLVRCTCGFSGSSAPVVGGPSEWDRHIRANR